MNRLIQWFLRHYPDIVQEMIDSRHDYRLTDPNPYHIEGDCWAHTMMVCKVAQMRGYGKTAQIASLLHDIGKPAVRRVNPRNNHVQFFDHEAVSAYMSIGILYEMLKDGMIDKGELSEIFALISLHSSLYKIEENQQLVKSFYNNQRLYLHLLELVECDLEGRFCQEGYCGTMQMDRYRSAADEMLGKEEQPEEGRPVVQLLCGVSNSGKSNWLKKENIDENKTIVISRDALVLSEGNGKNYSDSWASLDEEAHQRIDTEIEKQFAEAAKERKNIIVDMTNLTLKARSRWLSNLSEEYFSRIRIFLTPLETIKERAASQAETKHISEEVIDSMVKRFEHPLYDEVDSIVYEYNKVLLN